MGTWMMNPETCERVCVLELRKWEREDVCYTCCGNVTGNLNGKTYFHYEYGNGSGRKRCCDHGSGNGRLFHTAGWEAMEEKNMVALDGYVSVGRDSTTDSRPAPVPSRPPREFPSQCYPCKPLILFLVRLCTSEPAEAVVI